MAEPTADKQQYLSYGFCSYKPSCLQWLNKAVWFLIFMCYGNFFQSMLVNGLMGTVVSTLEKRFDLSSAQSSFIVSAYEIATVPMIIIVSYVGAKGHRPRWIAVTLLILALSGFVFAIPHFTTPVYNPREASRGDDNLCRNRSTENPCDTSQNGGSLTGYLGLFIVARVFMAIGATPLYTMGVTFLDDVVQKDTFSLYVALFYGFGVLGPATGLIGGGFLLNIFTDFQELNPQDYGIGPSDPRWIGAWWIGFLVGGAALLLIYLPFAGYAPDLPGAAEVRANKKSEAHANVDDAPTELDFGNIKELPRSLKIIVTNPAFMSLCFYGMTDGIIISGFTSYGPKFVENQFSISPGFAGMLFGLITIPGGVGGTIFGGAIIKCFKLSCRGILRTSALCNVIIISFSFLFFITCENTRFAGVNVGYNSSSVTDKLIVECNTNCMCNDVAYDPICGLDNIRYYSPCHAGCTNVTENGIKRFTDCNCINANDTSGVQATSQTCTVASCKLLPLWLVLFFLVMFLTFVSSALNISGTVRTVPSALKSLAIGFQWLCVRIIGTVPGPPMFGAVIDRSCQLWPKRCGVTGSCQFYSNEKMALYIFLLAVSVKILALIFLILAWRLYKPPAENTDPSLEINVSGENIDTPKSVPSQYTEAVEFRKSNGVSRVRPNGNTTGLNGSVNAAFVADSPATNTEYATTYM